MRISGTTSARRRTAARGLLWALALVSAAGARPARAQDLSARQELRRDLREYLFLNSAMGFRQRAAVYADDAAEGPTGRGELRFHLNGRYAASPTGGLGAYLGLGVVGRFGENPALGDPIRSPYDEFDALQNIRLFGAHVQYQIRDDDGRLRLLARAGRLSDFDARTRLLMYDGARVEVGLGRHASVGAYGGRRAVLDRDLPGDRSDLSAQLVSGVFLRGRYDAFTLQLSHRFEDVQQAGLRVGYADVDFGANLSAVVTFGGREAIDADVALTGLEAPDLPLALVVRFDADYGSPSGRTAAYLVSEVQVGVDPRVYGRGGRGPSESEIDAALRTTMSQARLDRLFLGPGQPHAFAEAGVEQWIAARVGLRAGGFVRVPLGDAAQRSLQPRIVEGWLGPEYASSRGDRVAVEVRLAAEDPGTPERAFSVQGDGERRFGALRAFAEIPLRFGDDWALSLRPELEGTLWDTEGPLSTTENQLGVYGGLLATLKTGTRFRTALRYGAGTQPDFTSAGVPLIHDLEVWVGGAF